MADLTYRKLVEPMTDYMKAIVAAIATYAQTHQVPVLTFAKGQRKDDVVAPYVARAAGQDRIVLIGKAQEKTTTFRTTKGQGPRSRDRYPRLFRTTAMVNHYYFYGVDEDFGPFSIEFSSHFPYTAKFCLNGHEYLKRQLTREGIADEALDNGVLLCRPGAHASAGRRPVGGEDRSARAEVVGTSAPALHGR